MDAADPGRAPRPALVPRPHEHQEQPDRVGAVALDQVVGILDVAPRLRHALAVGTQDLALVEQPQERLVLLDQADVAHGLGPEAAVQQVHHRVLGAAGVLVDRCPVIDQGEVDRACLVVRRQVAEPVPRRIDEGVHRVGLAPRGAAANRADRVAERQVVVERVVAAALVVDGLGQAHRQVGVGHGHDPVDRAVDDRERRAPVALAADQPVAQPVGDLGLGLAGGRELLDDRLAAVVGRHPVEPAAVDEALTGGVRDVGVAHRVVGFGTGGRDDAPDRQAEPLREREVALVVGGHGHDRARAVAGQHVIGDEDRDRLAVDGIDRVRADGDTGLLAIGRQAVDLRPPAGLLDVRVDFGALIGCRQYGHERVLRREDHERGTEQRVGPRREDAQGLGLGMVRRRSRLEVDLGAFRPADPVRLLDADRLGPVDAAEVEQLVGVGGRAQVPLLEIALLDQRAAAPAMAVDALDLLARQGPVVGTPVDGRQLAIGQALLQEAQEDPLVPAVVRRARR